MTLLFVTWLCLAQLLSRIVQHRMMAILEAKITMKKEQIARQHELFHKIPIDVQKLLVKIYDDQ